MPQLVASSKAGKAKAQFNTAYTLMAKAITDMDADDVSIDPNKYPTRTFYDKIKPYNKIGVDCGYEPGQSKIKRFAQEVRLTMEIKCITNLAQAD